MTPAQLRKCCLSMPGSEETFPFDPRHSVFKVGGKLFAITDLKAQPLRVSLKCEPELAEALRRTYPCVQPGYHLNKRHWNTVTIDGTISDEHLHDLVEDSYDLVVDGLPRAKRP